MTARFRDRAVVLGDVLVIADLHVGKDESANVELPLSERESLLERLGALVETVDPSTVVVAGDLLHSFDRVPTAARGTVRAIHQCIRDAGADAVVTPGNHDAMLDVVWGGRTTTEFVLDGAVGPVGGEATGPVGEERTEPGGSDGTGSIEQAETTVVCHGHAAPETAADCYVIGHKHPAMVVEGRKWHCSLYAPHAYDGADVLVLPAFSGLVEGTSINRLAGDGGAQSPLITDLGRFRPIIRDADAGETRAFPPLSEFRDLL